MPRRILFELAVLFIGILLGSSAQSVVAAVQLSINPSDSLTTICQQLNATPTPVVTPPVVVTPSPSPVPVSSGAGTVLSNVFTTGYANYDNTPRGSSQTDLGGHSGNTGGNGTYANPTTVAVGGSITNGTETDDFPYGTVFYVPNVRKYFKATDFCGDGNTPQNQPCHNLSTAPKGATLWIDLFVGGGSANEDSCEGDITALHTVILNPPSNLAVVSGDICSTSGVPQTQYGNTLVTL